MLLLTQSDLYGHSYSQSNSYFTRMLILIHFSYIYSQLGLHSSSHSHSYLYSIIVILIHVVIYVALNIERDLKIEKTLLFHPQTVSKSKTILAVRSLSIFHVAYTHLDSRFKFIIIHMVTLTHTPRLTLLDIRDYICIYFPLPIQIHLETGSHIDVCIRIQTQIWIHVQIYTYHHIHNYILIHTIIKFTFVAVFMFTFAHIVTHLFIVSFGLTQTFSI